MGDSVMNPLGRVLVLAPHTDDETIGAGGMIARLIEEGHEIFIRAFSSADVSLPEGYPAGTTRQEFAEAARVLGVGQQNAACLHYPVRRFPDFRQDILEVLIRMRSEIHPNTVLVPAGCDCHQDHRVIHDEAVRAFKSCTILGYEMPLNALNGAFRTDMFCQLEKADMERKHGAIYAYQSQLAKRSNMEAAVWSLARVRGIQVGVEFAEAYEVIRWII